MNVIGHKMPFQDLTFLLVCQLMEDTTQAGSYLTVELSSSPFWDEDQVILTIPF